MQFILEAFSAYLGKIYKQYMTICISILNVQGSLIISLYFDFIVTNPFHIHILERIEFINI